MNIKKIISNITKTTNLSEQQSWWLVEFITEKNRATLLANDYQLLEQEQKQLDQAVHEIVADHKPLAYILGWVPFLNLELSVKPPILIPRPETENWVAELIERIKNSHQKNITILDIGTGSGCIALSLAQALPQAQIYAIDINQQALDLAQENAQKNKIENITLIQSDLFTNIPSSRKFDLIVSNPPYINPAITLDPCVAHWEDHGALFANNAGAAIIEKIIEQAPQFLKKNNELEFQLVIEIDVTQGQIMQDLIKISDFKVCQIRKDQFDRDRTAWIS